MRGFGDRAAVLALVLLLALLFALGLLQYRWLTEISRAERERMTASLRGSLDALARDFDREINSAYVALQAGGDQSTLADRWDEWSASATEPRIVHSLWLAEANGDAVRLRRFNRAARDFESAILPAHLSALQPIIAQQLNRLSTAPTIDPTIPAIVSPMIDVEVPADLSPPVASASLVRIRGSIIHVFDAQGIREKLLPALIGRYLRGDYDVAVVTREAPARVLFGTAAPTSDATQDLFKLEPENTLAAITAVRGQQRIPTSVTVRTSKGGGQRTPFGAQWQLRARHRAGSLEAAVTRARTRNVAMSAAMLGLLGASVAFTWISARRAQRLARQQMEFVAAVSHELRTPLATIRSASDNLASGVVASPPRVQEYGALLRGEGERLSEMIEHVLEFARADSGRTGELGPIDVRHAIESALQMTSFAIERSRAKIDVEVGDLPPVRGDIAALARVIENLIANAIKYSDHEKWIAVRASAVGDDVAIEVEDHGPGIGAGDLPHIFEPFYRGSNVAHAQVPGTGLGLTVVKRVVTSFGGRVTVTSELGLGSTFRITFPAVRA